LVSRDIAQLFRFLQNHGVSQRRIAALTGQAQSEICEILAGRTVTSYPVLERIALGLGIPRGRLGLAYDENLRPVSQPSITQLSCNDQPSEPWAEPARGMDLNPDAKTSESVLTNSGTDINAIVRAVLAATPFAGRGEPLTTIGLWTGLHIRALRGAMRLSVRDFAQYLGVSDRMVSKWEAGGPNIQPRPVNQSVLDTCLDRLDDDARQRFTAQVEVVVVAGGHLSIDTAAKTRPHRRRSPRRFGATVPEQAEPTPSEG
jgi:transcriptional regulator with XRE-family HTH domain